MNNYYILINNYKSVIDSCFLYALPLREKKNKFPLSLQKKSMAKKNRINVVYSTNPNYQYETESENEESTLPPSQQDLRVLLDKKQRKGKAVTLITGFVGTEEDLKDLGKIIKTKCGVGGTVKEGEIMIQGDFRSKALEILFQLGYKAKQSGG
jgi:translation initiation factor 1